MDTSDRLSSLGPVQPLSRCQLKRTTLQAGRSRLEAVFPKAFQADFILRFEDLSKEVRSKKILFQVTEGGMPFVGVGHRLIALTDQEENDPGFFELIGADSVDDFAWMGEQ